MSHNELDTSDPIGPCDTLRFRPTSPCLAKMEKSLKIARRVLEGIRDGCRDPAGTASDALDMMSGLEETK